MPLTHLPERQRQRFRAARRALHSRTQGDHGAGVEISAAA